MRTVYNLNRKWAFAKGVTQPPSEMPELWNFVNLPHTWNGIDGQDGGGDYYRGTCCYVKPLSKGELPKAERYYLEINGANASADVFLNGKHLRHHDGGFSTWRVDLTDALEEENLLAVLVDNSPNDKVYPQMADFTFYGGLYRNVNLICVPCSHFDLDYYGGPGIQVTPVVEGEDARIGVEVFLSNRKPEQTVRYTLSNAEGKKLGTFEGGRTANFRIQNAHLWQGKKDPYLYRCTAELLEGGTVLDSVSTSFGCRSFAIDPERGFILNGKEYPLRGVSRHQDRWEVGNALLPEHHREDMDLICELGATTIRLAHYQHDSYFYDLCDQRGLVVWAEIPYISRHMPGGRENTLNQMRELIIQNYNHPSIVVWGLSNEITMNGAEDPDLLENHRLLNDLCHQLDKTRLTTLAALSNCPMDAQYLRIPDAVSYNHYFGWYGGETDMNGPWFDKFHAVNPQIPVGCSEYGAEGLNWHSSDPQQGDYTEEYQAKYHEDLIRQLFPRKFIWATHVWNMFDFGCDARSEGGENGQNHKGLVTIDRKYKKDAFYAYKAWLSEEPFVHICGKRYVDRVEDVTKVTVYSNQPSVELFANGVSLGRQEKEDHFFYFQVPNAGCTKLLAVAGECRDESRIQKVEKFNESYRLKESGAVLNWFDITQVDGYLSLNSKFGEIMATLQGKLLLLSVLGKKVPKGGKSGGMDLSSLGGMMDMLSSFTLIRLTGMMGAANIHFTKEELLELNEKLNKIKAPNR